MNVEELRNYCMAKKGVTETFPFNETTLVFKLMGKMFALMPLDRFPPQINLKCDPDWAEALREKYDGDIIPGFHMNKKHWNTVHIAALPDKFVLELTDHSYQLVMSKLPKKIREKIG